MQSSATGKLIVDKLRQDAYALQNAVYLSSELRKLWRDEEEKSEFLIQLFPDSSSSKIQIASYYPVIFDSETSEKNIEMSSAIRNHLGYVVGKSLPAYNLLLKDKIKRSPAEGISIEVLNVVGNKQYRIEREKLLDAIKKTYINHPFCKGQILLLSFEGITLTLKVNSTIGDYDMGYYSLKNDTTLTITENINSNVVLFDSFASQSLSIDFTDKGIAGLKKPIEKINQALVSRKVPQKLLQAMNKKPQQLLLFHGETGTGKTCLAKAVMQKLSNSFYTFEASKYKAETLISFFLQSQRSYDQDPNGPTYTILLDEIDKFPDEAILTLISYLEGPIVTPNLLVIATTNLDLEKLQHYQQHLCNIAVCVSFEIPSIQERLQILRLIMNVMEQNGLIDKSVSLTDLANRTDGYTPLQLHRLVALAQDYALAENFTVSLDQRNFNYRDDIKEINQASKVRKEHFEQALREIKPQVKPANQATISATSVLPLTGSPLHHTQTPSQLTPPQSEPPLITIHTLS